MPVDTYDAWVAKQIKAGGAKEEFTRAPSPENEVLPKDTFDSWIEKQQPKESVQPKSNSAVPDTFEVWMEKQIALKSSVEEKGQASPETEAPPVIATGSS